MRSAVAAVIVIAILVLSVLPARSEPGQGGHSIAEPMAAPPMPEAVTFPSGINTASAVTEYPLVSRALMLPGGSTDVTLADMNRDGRDDLIVAVSGANTISIFYGQAGGGFRSYPSHNISLHRTPIAVRVSDVFLSEASQIIVLEKKSGGLDADYIRVFNRTSDTLYYEVLNRSVSDNACSFEVGTFVGDDHPDLAIVCTGPNPGNEPGLVEIRRGPLFSSYTIVDAGSGTNSIAAADFNDDGLMDIAVGNVLDSNVMVFSQPFSNGMPASLILSTDSPPLSLSSGDFSDDTRADLVIGTALDSCAIRFFFQTAAGLRSEEDYNRTFDVLPTSIEALWINDDARTDILVLSAEDNTAIGFFQDTGTTIWPNTPDFRFPTGEGPRNAIAGFLDSDAVIDIAIASARSDWSGSSIAIYPGSDQVFNNSNMTTWTNRYAAASMIAVGDIDGNDSEDLVLLYPQTVSFGYKPSFDSEIYSWTLDFVPAELVVADLNHDGYDDVAVTSANGPEARLYWGNTGIPDSFPSTLLTCTGNVSDMTFGDFNHDSYEDLVIATKDGALNIYFNSGNSSAPYETPYVLTPSPGRVVWSVAVGDFDSDGRDDIAYANASSNYCSINILLQKNTEPWISLPAEGTTLTAAWVDDFIDIWSGDFTGDGRTDLAAMRSASADVYLYNQSSFWSTPGSYRSISLPIVPRFISFFDATDDGKADMLVTFDSADLLFLYKQSAGNIPDLPSMTFVTGARPNHATMGDATGDHRGDLLVCDSLSHSVSAWEQINFPPVADAGGPYITRQGDPLQFNGSAITGSSELPYMEYGWDFGDGNLTGWIREPRPVHTYYSLGTFQVTMEVRDPVGQNDSDNTSVDVLDSYPHVDFTWLPLNPYEGQLITFTNATQSYDEVVQLVWSINGAVVSTGMVSSIQIELLDGVHTVKLEATDSDGSVANKTRLVTVHPMDPVLELVGDDIISEGDAAAFEVVVDAWHDGGPVDPIVLYEWDFSYDGVAFVADQLTDQNSTTHVFGASGDYETYTVGVRVTDADGDESTAFMDVQVWDIGPVSAFILSLDPPIEGEPLRFISTTYTYDGITSWLWTLRYPGGSTEPFTLNASAMGALVFDTLDNGEYTMTLRVEEPDGDNDSFAMVFDLQDSEPSISISASPQQVWYSEFQPIDFSVTVDSYDAITGYEWDFRMEGVEFVPDRTTAANHTSYQYNWSGLYYPRVRVTDSDGSQVVDMMTIDVRDTPIDVLFADYVTVKRNPARTYEITFNASELARAFPDIVTSVWEFGDGTTRTDAGLATVGIVHLYDPTRDYLVNLTVTDDDLNSYELTTTLHLKHPTIVLISPSSGAVVRSGELIQFAVRDDSLPLVSVVYSVNGGFKQQFETMYEINTTGWNDGRYEINITAEDKDGNIAVTSNPIEITIDDQPPVASIIWSQESVYGGDKIEVRVSVDDENIGPGGVVLYVKFPGDSAFSGHIMMAIGNNTYRAIVEVPLRSGTCELYATAVDLAGHESTTETLTFEVDLHFIDAAWPYLLMIAILAALGTGTYFVREAKIAVDETFVIYNDGRLISHSTRRLKPGMDDQILSSMLTAIQEFVRDSFKDETSFTLRKLTFGEKNVLIEKGRHLHLAVVLHGKESRKVASRMRKVVADIEDRLGESIMDWDGDLDKVRGVNEMVKKLYSKAPTFFLR